MGMELVQIGKTGRPHGIKGEIKLYVDEGYEDDLFAAKALLIGQPALPYFIEKLRAGGSIIAKLEEMDQREDVVLLSNKPLFLTADAVTAIVVDEDHPFLGLVGYTIKAADYPLLGPIVDVMDLPEHHLAEIKYAGNTYYIPLHEDLIVARKESTKVVEMQLPDGLLD